MPRLNNSDWVKQVYISFCKIKLWDLLFQNFCTYHEWNLSVQYKSHYIANKISKYNFFLNMIVSMYTKSFGYSIFYGSA